MLMQCSCDYDAVKGLRRDRVFNEALSIWSPPRIQARSDSPDAQVCVLFESVTETIERLLNCLRPDHGVL